MMWSMSANAIETLFYPFLSGILEPLKTGRRVVFLNAQYHAALAELGAEIKAQQLFKPYADRLQKSGYAVFQSLEDLEETYDFAFVLLPKNQIEAMGLVARALKATKPGGVVIAAADNKAGGSRLPKMLKGLGLEHVQSESKNKARVVWAVRGDFDESAVHEAYEAARPQVLGGFETVPGIYGWDKVDRGSALLLEHLPEDLTGDFADFGCGYGLLSRSITQMEGVQSLTCIDADWRAVELCKKNIDAPNKALHFDWRDLTHMHYERCFDHVVMNPPFHEGKAVAPLIGQDFIRHAAQALRGGGRLWMVANVQLPYEEVLKAEFKYFEEMAVEGGFKILCAQK